MATTLDNRISLGSEESRKEEKSRRKHPVLRKILIDLICAGLALVVFALFHHVLPRQQQSLGIVIPNPNSSFVSQEENTSGLLDWLIPSAGAEGEAEGTLAASRGGNGGRGGKGGRGEGQSSKGGSALTEEMEETETETEETTPMAEKFADRYTDTVVQTETSYTSPSVAISVTRETLNGGQITYYLADIYLKDITSFRAALARDTYGSGYRDEITNMAALTNALLAVNGDYYGNTSEGVVIRNGVIFRANRTDCDVCVLYYDGTMRVMPGSSFTVEDAIADGAWQAWTFGPALLDGAGNPISSFASTGRIISANPRTAIGYYEPGHYCLVVVDGRGDSAGMTLPQLSQLFADLGCKAAYNLDGGNSSVMVWQGDVINDPSGGGRESSDAVLIAEVN